MSNTDWVTEAIAIVALLVSVVALAINLSSLVRRPQIVAEWGYVQDHPPAEGLSIIVTARRRPIEVDEIGLVVLPRKTRRRRIPEWLHAERPPRLRLRVEQLPKRLEDGQTLRAFGELDSVIDELHGYEGPSYPYVRASGTIYLDNDSKLRRRLRRRVES